MGDQSSYRALSLVKAAIRSKTNKTIKNGEAFRRAFFSLFLSTLVALAPVQGVLAESSKGPVQQSLELEFQTHFQIQEGDPQTHRGTYGDGVESLNYSNTFSLNDTRSGETSGAVSLEVAAFEANSDKELRKVLGEFSRQLELDFGSNPDMKSDVIELKFSDQTKKDKGFLKYLPESLQPHTIKAYFNKFLTHTKVYTRTFAAVRLMVNGTVTYHGLMKSFEGLDPMQALVIAATAGSASAAVQLKANWYEKMLNGFKAKYGELGRIGFWVGMEAAFLLTSTALLAAFGFPLGAEKLIPEALLGTSVIAPAVTLAFVNRVTANFFSQYFWSSGITTSYKDNVDRLDYPKDQSKIHWEDFKMKIQMLALSGLVTASWALSLSDVSEIQTLGKIGYGVLTLTGLAYWVKKEKELRTKITSTVKKAVKSCVGLLSSEKSK